MKHRPFFYCRNNYPFFYSLLATSLFLIFFVITPVHAEEQNHQHADKDHHGKEESGHEEHEESEIKLSPDELKEFSISLVQAGPGTVHKTMDLTGEVIVEPERLYHVVPRVSGVVRKVFKHLGERVKKGDLMATLSSRELADAKAQFVAADSLLQLANANLTRERKLFKSKITAKREYLAARQTQAEMSIKRKAAKQRLLALGLSEQAIKSILQHQDKDLTLYELRAPANGIIITKHAVQGEVLTTITRSFTVADLSKVWVNLTVYQKDLGLIHQGQSVLISSRFGGMSNQELSTSGTISWISPTLDERTRSATARVVIENPEGHWRPGLFVSAKVSIAKSSADIVVPLSALQTIDSETVVFIQHEPGVFEPQAVMTGRRDHSRVEILKGLKPGQSYVAKNAFALKAQLQKGDFGHGHSH